MGLVGALRRTLSGSEVEAGQPVLPLLLAVGNHVQAVFHLGRELVVHIPGEVGLQKSDYREGKPGRNQCATTLIDIAAIDNGRDDAGVGGRPTNLLGLKGLDQGGFGIAGRGLGLMTIGVHR